MSHLDLHLRCYGSRNPNCSFHSEGNSHKPIWNRNSRPTPEGEAVFQRKRKTTRKKRLIKKGQSRTSMGIGHVLNEAFRKSSIVGVNSIASPQSACTKLWWSLILVGCFVGFGYQAIKFAELYISLPSVVQINVEHDIKSKFPAITICNLNRVRMSVYCLYFSRDCQGNKTSNRVSDEFVKYISSELLRANITYLRKEFGHSEKMVLSCIFDGTPLVEEDECIKNIEYLYDPDFGNCYIIPSTNKHGTTLRASRADFWQETNDLSILINTELDEFMEGKRDPGIMVTIHDGTYYPDIHTGGFRLVPGYSYLAAVTKQRTIFLPFPYKTNCTDYLTLPWVKSDKHLTSRMCTVGCSQFHQFKTCGYVTEGLSLFYDKIPWDPRNVTPAMQNCAEEVENNTKSFCRQLCSVPCRNDEFEVSLGSHVLNRNDMRRHNSKIPADWKMVEKRKYLIHLKVYYKTLDHEVFEHKPKYHILQLFSNLGGYSGVWLGFSFLTIYEVTEILLTALNLALFKCKQVMKRKKRNRGCCN